MPVQRAKDHYLGKNGQKRLNCAQSVLAAFADHYGIDQQQIEAAVLHGGGKAPGGVCGAYCAAREILNKHHPEKLDEFDHHFKELAGSLDCWQIRGMHRLSCLGCIEKAAEYIYNNSARRP